MIFHIIITREYSIELKQIKGLKSLLIQMIIPIFILVLNSVPISWKKNYTKHFMNMIMMK